MEDAEIEGDGFETPVDKQAEIYARKILDLSKILNYPELYSHFVLEECLGNKYLVSKDLHRKMERSELSIESYIELHKEEISALYPARKGLDFILLLPRSKKTPDECKIEEEFSRKDSKYNPLHPNGELKEILSRTF